MLEHREREKRSIRGRKDSKRLSYLLADALLFDLFHCDICRIVCGFCPGEITDECSMTAETVAEDCAPDSWS